MTWPRYDPAGPGANPAAGIAAGLAGAPDPAAAAQLAAGRVDLLVRSVDVRMFARAADAAAAAVAGAVASWEAVRA